MKKGAFIVLFLILASLQIAYAANESYINAEVYIQASGGANIIGTSNTDLGISGISLNNGRISGETQELTSKQGGLWTFSLQQEKNYSSIQLKIYFPRDIKALNNIKSNLNYNMGIGNRVRNIVTLNILDSNKPINIRADYELNNSTSYIWILIVLLILVILGLIIFIFFRRAKKGNKLDFIMPLLGENEEKIIKLLMKRAMRQKEIRKELGIPKASFSRYMLNLEKKKIIIREGEGKNKIVRLK